MKGLYIIFLWGVMTSLLWGCEDDKTDERIQDDQTVSPDTSGLISGGRLQELNNLIIADPNNPRYYFDRAYANYYLANVDEALIDIKHAIELDGNNASYYFAKGLFFHSVLKLEEAKTAFVQAIELDGDIKQANLYLAKIYLALYRYDKVFEHVNNELRLDPNTAEAYFLKGVAYEEQKDTSNAASSYITATEQDPDYYEAYIRLGVLYGNRKDPLALEFYRNALRIRPTSTEVLYNMGVFYQNTMNLDQAEATYQRIIELNPAYALSYYNLGYMYMEYDTAYSKAIVHFKKAIENNAGNYTKYAYFNLGLAYERAGKLNEAVLAYGNAVQVDADYTDAILAINRLTGR